MNPYDRMDSTETSTGVNANAAVDLTDVLGKLRSGSPALIEEGYIDLIRHFKPQILSIASHFVHNPADVAEVQAQFQLKFLQSFHTFHGTTPGELTNWVRKMTHNLAVDLGEARTRDDSWRVSIDNYEKGLLNLQARRQEFQRPLKRPRKRAHPDRYRVCDVIDSLGEDQFLQHALHYLSPNQCDCIKLRADGYTNPQIAAKLNMLPTTVACHVSRGCKRLVELLIQYRRTRATSDTISST